MDLRTLIMLQHNFDRSHGWSVDEEDFPRLLRVVSDDIVGLVGEVGEFANIVKKINVVAGKSENMARRQMEKSKPSLAEELTDSMIYIMRLAAHLNIDLEQAYLAKLKVNRKRYKKYER